MTFSVLCVPKEFEDMLDDGKAMIASWEDCPLMKSVDKRKVNESLIIVNFHSY